MAELLDAPLPCLLFLTFSVTAQNIVQILFLDRLCTGINNNMEEQVIPLMDL